MKRFSFLLLLSGLTMMSWAQSVSIEDAESRARDFLCNEDVRYASSRDGSAIESHSLQLAYVPKNATYFVFNDGSSEDGGFVIVGGDERARTILGYSDKGHFDWDTAPDNFKWWLSQFEVQIEHAIERGDETLVSAPSRPAKADVMPIIHARWDQSEPYNLAIPVMSGQHPVTGCMATAMAMAMHHYRYPVHGTGSHRFSSKAGIDYSADFSATTYDWDNMLDVYQAGNYSSAQANAVATLMYHCGVSMDMNYTVNSSGAGVFTIAPALANYFDYDRQMAFAWRDYYTDNDWEDLVHRELSLNRPVLYGGQSVDGGHQFICDGYDSSSDFYHFNWGWGSYCDGYYPLTGVGALAPNGSGIGGAGNDAAYTDMQLIVTGFLPNQGNPERLNFVNYSEGALSLSPASVNISKKSVNVTLTASYINIGLSAQAITLGIKAVETTTGKVYYFPYSNTSSIGIGYYTSPGMSFDAKKLQYNGTYRIYPVYRPTNSTSNDDWQVALIPLSKAIPTLTVTGGVTDDPVDISFTISDNEVEVARSLKISVSETYDGQVTYSSSNENIATVAANGVVTGVAVGHCTITASGPATSMYNATTTTFDIEVKELVKSMLDINLDNQHIAVGETATVLLNSDYDGQVTYESMDHTIATVSSNGIITGISAGTVEIRVIASEGTVYRKTSKLLNLRVDPVITARDGLMFTAAPYFNNDNHPTVDDFDLRMPIYNNSNSAVSGLFTIYVPELQSSFDADYGSFSARLQGTASLSFKGIASLFDVGKSYHLTFYNGPKGSQVLMNIPTISFTLSEVLDYDYTLTSAGVGTLVLPFSCEVPLGLNVYKCTTYSDGELTLSHETSIKMNTPYIIVGTPGTYHLSGPGAENTLSVGNGLLVGVLEDEAVQLQEGDYILQNHNGVVGFYRIGANQVGRYAAKNRAFLRIPESMLDMFRIPNMGDETTTLGVLPGSEQFTRYYGIDGTSRSSLMPGFNLFHQGDKVRKAIIR